MAILNAATTAKAETTKPVKARYAVLFVQPMPDSDTVSVSGFMRGLDTGKVTADVICEYSGRMDGGYLYTLTGGEMVPASNVGDGVLCPAWHAARNGSQTVATIIETLGLPRLVGTPAAKATVRRPRARRA